MTLQVEKCNVKEKLSNSKIKYVMKSILVITILDRNEDLIEQFMAVGIETHISVFFYRPENERNLLDRIKKSRPAMIIMDGRIHPLTLENIYDSIFNTLGVYDMDSNIYAIKKEVHLPGVINTKIENFVKIWEESRK